MKIRRYVFAAGLTLVLVACGGGKQDAILAPAPVIMSAPPSAINPIIPMLAGPRANYTITQTPTGYMVTDVAGATGTQTFGSNITKIVFSDMSVNLEVGANSQTIAPADLQSIVELYIAYFNRLPDADGLNYWINQFKAGQSINTIAENFYLAAMQYPALTGYSPTMTIDQFITLVYANVLGRTGATAPNAAELEYWRNDILSGRQTHGTEVRAILVSAHLLKGDATFGWVANLLDNKLKVANFFAIEQGLNYSTQQDSITKTMAMAAAITPTSTAGAIAILGKVDWSFMEVANPTFPTVTSNTTPSYFVLTNAGEGTSISLTSATVESGKTASFTVTLAAGYEKLQASGCGGVLVGNMFTTGAVTGNCTVQSSATKRVGGTGYTIETFAGSGALNLGDGGPAINAMLVAPQQVMVSSSGDVYIADTNNNRITVVDSGGIIKTFAGHASAENQPLGDGGSAVDAVVRFPRSLYETSDGLYIGDHSYTIRLVDKKGTISHAAIDNRADFILPWSIAVDAQKRIYIADITHHRVLRADTNGTLTVIAGTGTAGSTGDGGLATEATLNSPSQIKFDGQGHLLIGSSQAPLRQIDLATGVISKRLEQRMAYFDIDATGAFVYSGQYKVMRVNQSSGTEVVVAGTGVPGFSGDGGKATAAQFGVLQGVSIDAFGNIFVADTGNNRIRKISSSGVVTTFAGSGASPASLDGVTDTQGLGFDNQGNLLFTDFSYNYLRRVSGRRSIVVAGTGIEDSSGDGASALMASFAHPSMIAFDKSGQLFFLDLNWGTGSVRMIKPGIDGTIGGNANETIMTVAGKNVSRDFADNGSADTGSARNAVFTATRDFLIDSKGNLIIADWLGNRIRKVIPGADGIFNGGADEVITTIAGNGTAGQSGDGGPATRASVEGPNRIAIDANDNIYAFVGVNTNKVAIRRIDAKTGIITTIATNVVVADMVITPAGDLIYTNNTQVIKIDLTSNQSTVIAGTGALGFSGDGGDAALATFRGASYLAVDAAGNIYVADNGNFRIRRLVKAH